MKNLALVFPHYAYLINGILVTGIKPLKTYCKRWPYAWQYYGLENTAEITLLFAFGVFRIEFFK
jgi:hypothetical protein